MLQKLSSQSYKTTSLVMLSFAMLWFLPDFLFQNPEKTLVSITIFKKIELFSLPFFVANVLQFFFVAFSLLAVNRLVRNYQFLPMKPNILLAVGGFLFAAVEPFHYFSSVSIALIFFSFSAAHFAVVILDKNAQQSAFRAVVLNLFGAIFEPSLLLVCLLILFVLCSYKMLSAKSLLACFLALIFVAFLVMSGFFLLDKMDDFQLIWHYFGSYAWQPDRLKSLLSSLPIANWILASVLVILFCIVLISNLLLVQKIKSLTRFYYLLVGLLSVFSLVFACFFYESFTDFLFISLLFLALQLALFFSYQQKLYGKILFYSFAFFCVSHRILLLMSYFR